MSWIMIAWNGALELIAPMLFRYWFYFFLRFADFFQVELIKEPLVVCDCGTQFCFSCGFLPHAPATCYMIKEWEGKRQKDEANTKFLAAYTKNCPKCNFSIFKEGLFQFLRNQILSNFWQVDVNTCVAHNVHTLSVGFVWEISITSTMVAMHTIQLETLTLLVLNLPNIPIT